MSQAVNYFNQASTLANQGQWQNAVGDLNQAQSYVSQASAAEGSYNPNPLGNFIPSPSGSNSGSNSQYNTLVLAIGAIAALIVVAVAIYLFSRSSRTKVRIPVQSG
ncbi:MAG TPA: hypothetical protein VFF30_08215 [Nitrososphaerales archaeon]|nr:hypothetical protein [Nitrososphaerales archaeon]